MGISVGVADLQQRPQLLPQAATDSPQSPYAAARAVQRPSSAAVALSGKLTLDHGATRGRTLIEPAALTGPE